MNHEKIEGWSERFDKEFVNLLTMSISSEGRPGYQDKKEKVKEFIAQEITSAEQRGEERERERITKWENLLIYFAQLIDIRTGHHSQQDVDANTVKELLTAITSRNQE